MKHISYILGVLGIFLATQAGCAASGATGEDDGAGGDGATSTSAGGTGGMAGAGGSGEGGNGLCEVDCSTIDAPDCSVAVCNDGSHQGTVGTCVVVAAEDGTSCDDGQFCTIDDTCQAGACTGGGQNDCGMAAGACETVVCNETSASCSTEVANNGDPCAPENLCEVGGQCQNGLCVGQMNDCFFAPLDNDCQVAVCNPDTGMCEPETDPTKDGDDCLFGDLCMVNKTCSNGQCVGGDPKDCSQLNVGCTVGVCDQTNGACVGQNVPTGGMCFDGVDDCNTGTCDMNGTCVLTPVMDGSSCNDFNSCTNGDLCTTGVCGGTLDPNCTTYFEESFELGCPPPGWTLAGEWECGTPTNVGPLQAHGGAALLGTDLDAEYNNGNTYAAMVADTPVFDLSTSTEPKLAYWHYVETESCCDGYNVKISTDGGNSFSILTTVDPPYDGTIGGETAYRGDQSAVGWQPVIADLSAYVGQQVVLRWSFRSDSSVTDPGIYVDDITVSEAADIPLSITTPSLGDAAVGYAYLADLSKVGGSTGSTWSIQGGTNHGWLSINSATGELSGTPAATGMVTVTVRVEEPTNPSNFDEVTFGFDVLSALYFSSFETCPDGWTLTGQWQCGAPTSGPGFASGGAQCLATNLSGDYSNGIAWGSATASSPAISLVGTTAPALTFDVWHDTEGSSYDGFNVKASTDGVTYSIVTSVTPAYNTTVSTQSCWGGDESALGWQTWTADLTAYAGQTVYLRFDMRTDGSVTNPGVYVDNVIVAD